MKTSVLFSCMLGLMAASAQAADTATTKVVPVDAPQKITASPTVVEKAPGSRNEQMAAAKDGVLGRVLVISPMTGKSEDRDKAAELDRLKRESAIVSEVLRIKKDLVEVSKYDSELQRLEDAKKPPVQPPKPRPPKPVKQKLEPIVITPVAAKPQPDVRLRGVIMNGRSQVALLDVGGRPLSVPTGSVVQGKTIAILSPVEITWGGQSLRIDGQARQELQAVDPSATVGGASRITSGRPLPTAPTPTAVAGRPVAANTTGIPVPPAMSATPKSPLAYDSH